MQAMPAGLMTVVRHGASPKRANGPVGPVLRYEQAIPVAREHRADLGLSMLCESVAGSLSTSSDGTQRSPSPGGRASELLGRERPIGCFLRLDATGAGRIAGNPGVGPDRRQEVADALGDLPPRLSVTGRAPGDLPVDVLEVLLPRERAFGTGVKPGAPFAPAVDVEALAGPGDLATEDCAGAQTDEERRSTDRCDNTMPYVQRTNLHPAEVGLATGCRHESGDRSIGRRAGEFPRGSRHLSVGCSWCTTCGPAAARGAFPGATAHRISATGAGRAPTAIARFPLPGRTG